MSFQEALDNCCKCKDDGNEIFKQPFMHSYMDARAADFRKPMAGAVDFASETTDDGGIKTTQVTYPLEYEPTLPYSYYAPEPISPLSRSQQAADQGK